MSAVSAWEVAIKAARGKLRLPPGGEDQIRASIAAAGFDELAVTLAHGFAVRFLPRLHADPFDRLLVAQCQAENLTLVTNDRVLLRYRINHLW